jgi:hypothetical protein
MRVADELVCNENNAARMADTRRTLLAHVPAAGAVRAAVTLRQADATAEHLWGQSKKDERPFDRVLVDAPCLTDKDSVRVKDTGNLFHVLRVRQRQQLPGEQTAMLM